MGFDCLSIYNDHDGRVVCHCGIPRCPKCGKHFFWESNKMKLEYCSIHEAQSRDTLRGESS